MKLRTVALLSLFCLCALTITFAQNGNIGTWKLNEAKSSIPAGMGKTTTVVYAPDGDKIKITGDGVDAQGKPTHTEWTGKFDAKPYPLSGDSGVTYRAYKLKNERLLLVANMLGDKTVSNGKIELAKNGKSRTVSMTYFEKKKIHAKYLYEKQ
jgi:hypothetical protein